MNARDRVPAAAASGPPWAARAIRLAILATALAVVLSITLLIEETPYGFTTFMVLGPMLVVAAFVLLGAVILSELRSGKIL